MAAYAGPEIVEDGLVLYLDAANERSYPGSGDTCYDLSGNYNVGNIYNGTSFSDNALGEFVFDGVNDYIDFSNNFNMGLNSLTIVCWVKPLSIASANDWFLSKARAAGQNHRFGLGVLGGTNQPRIFFCGANNLGDKIGNAEQPLQQDVWTMVTGIWNRNGSMQMFLNDTPQVLSGNYDISAQSTVDMQSSNPYRVGSYTGSDNYSVFNPFHGSVSQVIHYTRVLSDAEISKNFNATRSRFGI